MSRPAIEAFALRAVGEAVRVYADSMPLEVGHVTGQTADAHLYGHLIDLAEHLDATAHDVARVAKISRILETSL